MEPLECKDKRVRHIGLLGGSFNPPHEGHLFISHLALKKLGLDEIWWLVSPQNPLKSEQGMAKFSDRFAMCEDMLANESSITPSVFESENGLQYSIDTVDAIQKAYPDDRFVWLMGADNLCRFHLWHRWREMFQSIPIAVFERDNLRYEALSSVASKAFLSQRWRGDSLDCLQQKTPVWCFIDDEQHPASSTAIREEK